MELTILMPCLNEAETIVQCIQKARDFLKVAQAEGEVLIADNGSTDQSKELAILHGARVIHVPTKGYGAALIAGIEAAHGKYIIMGDADDSYDFSALAIFLQKLREGYELVMGNRFQGGVKPGAMPFLNRYLGNPVLSFLGRLFFKSSIGDFHCGLRGFQRGIVAKLQLQSPGMEFASEMVIKASLKNIKIAEVPTTLSPDGRSRPPHLRKWRDGWRHLRLLLAFSPRWLFFYPGAALFIVGSCLLSILSFSHLTIGAYSLGVHTLLFASAFIIIGIQCIFFSCFSRLIAVRELGLPLDQKLERIIKKFTLEKGIILGLILMLLGVVGSLFSVAIWAHEQFGSLIPEKMMRLTIPSITFLIVGTQIIFSAFFMSVLNVLQRDG
jgi:glycosyltransferase involved in cell wall biosynthesis